MLYKFARQAMGCSGMPWASHPDADRASGAGDVDDPAGLQDLDPALGGQAPGGGSGG